MSSTDKIELPITIGDASANKPIERKYWLRPLILVLLIVGLSIGMSHVTSKFSKRGYQGGSDSGQGIGSGFDQEDEPKTNGTEAPVAPTPSPTMRNTAPPTSSVKSSLEYRVISPNLANPDLLLDTNTPQGEAFAAIASEGLTNSFHILQRFVLMVLFFSTEGLDWTVTGSDVFSLNDYGTYSKGWSSFSRLECSWHGVECTMQSNGESAVTAIRLESNNLNGMFPPEICLLTKLEELVITNSTLHSELPLCIRDMSALVDLNLDGNQLTGSLPSGMLLAPSLEVLTLSNNQFTGKLSVMFEGAQFTLKPTAEKLRRLNLENNGFAGETPALLSLLHGLEELTLHGNFLTGTIDVHGSGTIDATCGLEMLTADCSEVTCTCCTECY